MKSIRRINWRLDEPWWVRVSLTVLEVVAILTIFWALHSAWLVLP